MKVATRGYTFIELLVAITISIVVFTIGYAGYREFSRRQQLEGLAKNLKSDLRTAQQLALSGQKPSGVSCDVLDGYSFSLTSPTNYKILVNCVSAGGVASTPEYKSVDLQSGITMTSTNASFKFKALGHGTTLVAVNNIVLTATSTGDTKTVVVRSGGLVK